MEQLPVGRVSRGLLVMNAVMALLYMSVWFTPGNAGNAVLYSLLFAGEIYHVGMAILFWHTIWPGKQKGISVFAKRHQPTVDVFITVAGEPTEIVEKTALAAKEMAYPNHRVFILNDGRVAKKENWREIERMAARVGVGCITRTVPGGAKAGNINNALKRTSGKIVVVFDADMVPNRMFLKRVIPPFSDSKIGFVQTPQFYKNWPENLVTGSSWEQQEFFFGAIMTGKDKSNAAFICGTNVAIRREALEQAGGMNEKNIAEDFLTSLDIHRNGWRSMYLNEVLATGLAPEDMLSYYKQQLRWARGSLEVLFGHNPLFKRGFSIRQKAEYLSSALYYFNGVVVLIDMMMPLMFLFFGLEPVQRATASFALYFLPFLLLNLYTLSLASRGTISFRAIAFSYSSWELQIKALLSVVLRQKMGFSVTPKQAQSGNFLFLAYPHMGYAFLILAGVLVAIWREGFNPSVTTNIAWGILNVVLFTPFIIACGNWGKKAEAA